MGVGVLVVFFFIFVFFIVFISTAPSVSGWRWCSIVLGVVLPVFFFLLFSILVGCLGEKDHPPLGDDVPDRQRGDDDERGGTSMHEPACIGDGRMVERLTCACSCLDDEL